MGSGINESGKTKDVRGEKAQSHPMASFCLILSHFMVAIYKKVIRNAWLPDVVYQAGLVSAYPI